MTENSRIRVMWAVKRPDELSNPYISRSAAEASKVVDLEFLNWRRLLFRQPEVLHVHWPEQLMRGRSKITTLGLAMVFLLVFRPRKLRRMRIVWTVHNLRPHEAGHAHERLLYRWFLRSVDMNLYINNSRENSRQPQRTILHGLYDIGTPPSSSKGAPANLLLFGQIRPYKGVEELLRAYRGVDSSRVRLRIVGRSLDANYLSSVTDLARQVGAELIEGHVDDERLHHHVAWSDLVVLPYPALYNSGVLLFALSCNRPVLTAENDQTRLLKREFGEDWVRLYSPPLNARDLVESVSPLSPDSMPTPDPERSWDEFGARILDVYHATVRQSPRETH